MNNQREIIPPMVNSSCLLVCEVIFGRIKLILLSTRGEVTLLVVHWVPPYTIMWNTQVKVAMTIQMQVLIRTFGPLQNFRASEHPRDLECICLVVHSVCDINLHPVNCPYITLLFLHLYGNRGVLVFNWNGKEKKKKKKFQHVLYFTVFVVTDSAHTWVNIMLHMTTRW